MTIKTDTITLVNALKILSEEIESADGVANAVIFEAAERLDDMREALEWLVADTKQIALTWRSWINASEILDDDKYITVTHEN